MKNTLCQIEMKTPIELKGGKFLIVGSGLLKMSTLLLFFVSMIGCAQGTFDEMANNMSSGNAPVIKSSELKSAMVFLDAREKDEFEVSHLEGARWIGYDHFDLSSCSDIPKDQAIVVYCSVGYRSGKIAEKLKRAGYTNVYNLWGGIFDWINSGKKVVNEKGVTKNVHPYNEKWGKWLTAGNKVYE